MPWRLCTLAARARAFCLHAQFFALPRCIRTRTHHASRRTWRFCRSCLACRTRDTGVVGDAHARFPGAGAHTRHGACIPASLPTCSLFHLTTFCLSRTPRAPLLRAAATFLGVNIQTDNFRGGGVFWMEEEGGILLCISLELPLWALRGAACLLSLYCRRFPISLSLPSPLRLPNSISPM